MLDGTAVKTSIVGTTFVVKHWIGPKIIAETLVPVTLIVTNLVGTTLLTINWQFII